MAIFNSYVSLPEGKKGRHGGKRRNAGNGYDDLMWLKHVKTMPFLPPMGMDYTKQCHKPSPKSLLITINHHYPMMAMC